MFESMNSAFSIEPGVLGVVVGLFVVLERAGCPGWDPMTTVISCTSKYGVRIIR